MTIAATAAAITLFNWLCIFMMLGSRHDFISSSEPDETRPSTSLAPNHHDARGHAAAHVEGQKTLDSLHLVIAGGPSELAIRFDHLANTCRADGVAVAHETAARIDRQG